MCDAHQHPPSLSVTQKLSKTFPTLSKKADEDIVGSGENSLPETDHMCPFCGHGRANYVEVTCAAAAAAAAFSRDTP